MQDYELSILIPARSEMFVAQTVKDILQNKRGKTEILVGLDGEWADPGIPDHPDVTIVYYPESIGQRAMTNQLCKLSKAKYVMKCDAHCAFDEGFDVKLMTDMEDDMTMIPALYNLHAFDWKCLKCGNTWYQGPEPKHCMVKEHQENPKCDSTQFEMEIVWEPRLSRRSEFYRFDLTMHFQYHSARKKALDAQDDIAETMSAQGSCFILTREKYWELKICDEEFGSWGQQGVEVACKTWLSGGRLVTNKKTWYSHMFRTQTGFGFPYPQSGRQVENARKHSRDLFLDNTWEGQKYPLSWLLEKFRPLPDWHDPEGKELLDEVNRKGEEFYLTHQKITKRSPKDHKKITKGIIFYTDNALNLQIAHACKRQIKDLGLPIVSSSLKPMDFGKNIHMKLQRGYEAYFRQILACLEASDSEIIYFCEHDWLYNYSHFDFTPLEKDVFYYNLRWYRVRVSDGYAIHYDTQMVPGLVAYREILLDHYRNVVNYLEKVGFTSENARQVGFEPGTTGRVAFGRKYRIEHFKSKYPIIDLRHDNNLTVSKWSQAEFRNLKNAENWISKDASEIEGWNFTKGDFIGSLNRL